MILVIGAAGKTGKAVVKALAAKVRACAPRCAAPNTLARTTTFATRLLGLWRSWYARTRSPAPVCSSSTDMSSHDKDRQRHAKRQRLAAGVVAARVWRRVTRLRQQAGARTANSSADTLQAHSPAAGQE